MRIDAGFKFANVWKDGTRQEIIIENDTETLADVVQFLKINLEYFDREDLTFDEREIVYEDGVYWVTLRQKIDTEQEI
ncbi:hypothetical protein [Dyadobacter sandarakinus]|uniref:Uncharacterized protein n=1 Tax=Dyadobacter sandarakinus TaxID=2747268 RepID=A0ABX7I1F1_9BACT|nr:hypothetical protein [Dyadobacter sandarakinus]QRQ99734.1 hypothetical protein HWI92_01780 [Dyadobacter sandarakinus]